MVASIDIKFYVHTNNNAPQLENAYGSMINVLDACLIDGIQIGVVSSLTASGNTVTVTFGAAHNLMQYQVIKITGANQPEFNGEHRILTIPDSSSLTFELAAAPSVSTATGTISASLPPLGWEKPFSSSNQNGGGKAAYRSKNLLLPSRPFLRVLDELDPAYTATYAKYAKVGIVEDMTDINTMLGVQAPYDSANPNKNWVGSGSGASAYNGWAKWYYARSEFGSSDASAPANGIRMWILVGNKDYFYVIPSDFVANGIGSVFGFGAFKSFLNVDMSNTYLSANTIYQSANNATSENNNSIGTSRISAGNLLLQRGYSQAAQSTTSKTVSLHLVNADLASGTQNHIGAYSLANVAPFAPVFINEAVLRGELPNLYYLFQNKPYSNLQLIEKDGGLYIAKNIKSSSVSGQVVLKIGEI